MEKVRVNYTDNTKEGMKKKRRENILKKLEPMSSVIQDRITDLELQAADIQLDLDVIDNVYHRIEQGYPVSRKELDECKYLYEHHLYQIGEY